MNSTQAVNLDWHIQKLEDYMKDLEYQFATAADFGHRREIYIEYQEIKAEHNDLVNLQEW